MSQDARIEERIRKFVLDHFPLARKSGLERHDKWLESGLMDSLGILDLVAYLERDFSIQAADEELVPENFESLSTVVQYTQKKLAATAQVNRT